jgi:MFS family permease
MTITTLTTPVRRSRLGFWLAGVIFAIGMMGGTLPIPLYITWSQQFDFGPLTTTLIFSSYAVGVVVALMVFGSWSDRSGRRPVLLAALSLAVISTLLFLVADDVNVLLLARFCCGVATGIIAAASSAAIQELAGTGGDRRASMLATGANLGGLGAGVIGAGVMVQFLPHPTRLVFWIYLALLIGAMTAVIVTPETVPERRWAGVSPRWPKLPAEPVARREFSRIAAAAFSAFAVNGVFSSLVPVFLHEQLQVQSIAVIGSVVGLVFIGAMAAQLAAPTGWLRSLWIAPLLLVNGVILLEVSLWTGTLAIFLSGTVLASTGIGLTVRQGIATTQRLADPGHRADQVATFFLVSYSGTVIPTVLLGVLDQTLDRKLATLILPLLVVVVSLSTAVAGHRSRFSTLTIGS